MINISGDEFLLLLKENVQLQPGHNVGEDQNLSKLLGRKLTQQQSIKIGNDFDKLVAAMLKRPELECEVIDLKYIRTKTGKKKQVDLLFRKAPSLFYYELKANVNLDSEKAAVTIEKIEEVRGAIAALYPDENVESGLLNIWFEPDGNLPDSLKGMSITYMKDFFLKVGIQMSKQDYHSSWEKRGELA